MTTSLVYVYDYDGGVVHCRERSRERRDVGEQIRMHLHVVRESMCFRTRRRRGLDLRCDIVRVTGTEVHQPVAVFGLSVT
jgi:hypothetical protein